MTPPVGSRSRIYGHLRVFVVKPITWLYKSLCKEEIHDISEASHFFFIFYFLLNISYK